DRNVIVDVETEVLPTIESVGFPVEVGVPKKDLGDGEDGAGTVAWVFRPGLGRMEASDFVADDRPRRRLALRLRGAPERQRPSESHSQQLVSHRASATTLAGSNSASKRIESVGTNSTSRDENSSARKTCEFDFAMRREEGHVGVVALELSQSRLVLAAHLVV